MMDFSKFRESGDLSDVTVSVDSKEYKLHKFPLFARSDYFCELARSQPGSETEPFKVELKDFPGGGHTFEQVADFCYNMPLNLNKSNAVALRCAAEYLKMFGSGNLKDVAGKFVTDTLSSARTNRLTSIILSMLMDCNTIGEIAESAGIVDACVETFVDCWVKSVGKYPVFGRGRSVFKVAHQSGEAMSAFTRVEIPRFDKLDESSVKCLLSLRVDWFAKLLIKAGSKGIRYNELGSIAVRYISNALNKVRASTGEHKNNNTENECSGDNTTVSDNNCGKITVADDDKDIDTNNSMTDQERLVLADFDKQVAQFNTSSESKVEFNIGTILDKIVALLPDQAFSIPEVTINWLTETIYQATLHGCECRGKLVKMAGEMLTKLDPKDLCFISSAVLHDIVVDASDDKHEAGSRMPTDRACNLVDKYMVQMAKEGTLTSEMFRLLASATKNYNRVSHDLLYNALEFVMKSEKDKLSIEQLKELTDFVNFDHLSESKLQKALDSEVVPATKIAQSAIKLCSSLRTELASVKCIAEIQEEDIQKYHTSSTTAPTIKSPSGYIEHDDSADRSSQETARNEDLDSSDPYPSTDPVKAAHHVLSAARHKLNLPVYTGYRPASLSRYSPPTYGGHFYMHKYHTPREHDIGVDEELDFKYDRSFQSLDPRVRYNRINIHTHRPNIADDGHRTYFPYTSHTHRF